MLIHREVVPHFYGLEIAQQVVEDVQPYADRVAIAGSLRRNKPTVHDIEILCIPKPSNMVDMFGDPVADADDMVTAAFRGHLSYDLRPNKAGRTTYGPKNKLLIHKESGVAVDLFSTTAENWGMALVIRTGSADFNVWLMQRFKKMGIDAHAYGGLTLDTGEEISLPTEEDVFRWANLDIRLFPPEARNRPK